MSSSSRWTVALAAAGLLCLAAGLTEFSRRIARGGPTDAIDVIDVIDAMMSALATYLLLWTLHTPTGTRDDPRTRSGSLRRAGAFRPDGHDLSKSYLASSVGSCSLLTHHADSPQKGRG